MEWKTWAGKYFSWIPSETTLLLFFSIIQKNKLAFLNIQIIYNII